MNRFALLLAWRYILGARHEKNINIMIKICFLGIFIGSFSLTLVTAIMNGFEKATHEKMQGVHAQISMRGNGDSLDAHAIGEVLTGEFPEIQSYSPTSLHQAIIQPISSDDVTNVIMLKALDPKTESLVTALDSKIIASRGTNKTLAGILTGNSIIIGKALADQLSITVGDTINILYTRDEQARSRRITLQESQAIIGGILSSGIEEFDATLILCSFNFFDTLFPEYGITQISLKLKDGVSEQTLIDRLKKRFDLDVYSWKDLYPALVAALKLEKIAMFMILALITLVASMNIISLIFMQITQKKGDIAVLKSLGTSDATIVRAFLGMGMGISSCATILGITLAAGACWFLETYPFISLPDAYYVSHLPASMDWLTTALIFTLIIGISFLATWIPARRSKSINIAQVLRFEA